MNNGMGGPLLIVASPRKKGNCATIAGKIAAHLKELGQAPEMLFLQDFLVKPCIACDICLHTLQDMAELSSLPDPVNIQPAFACPLTRLDQSTGLLAKVWHATSVFVVTPIYFYHLPAQFKALVDRFQSFWNMEETGTMGRYDRPLRSFYPVLVAARTKGDKLFEGSLLSLRQAFKPLNIQQGKNLEFYGLDLPGDFINNPGAQEKMNAYLRHLTDIFGGAGR